jgi:ribosome-associated protein
LSDESPAKEGGKLLRILEKALDRGAFDPVLLDVREVASFADVFVLLSGRSDRQARAIADAVVEAMRDAADAPLGVEGLAEGRWILIDCNDVIVHVFAPDIRDLYALERLWSDAPVVDLAELGLDPHALAAATADAADDDPDDASGQAGRTRTSV